MGHLPAFGLHRSHLPGRDLLLRHRHGDQPAGRLPAAGPLHLQAAHPLQGPAGGPVPDAALLPGPGAEPRGPCGGAAVRGREPDPAAGPGAAQRGGVSADIQRAGRARVPVHSH